MTTYPVFDCHCDDFNRTRGVINEPIGQAETEAEALELLRKHFAGTGAQPIRAWLADASDDTVGWWVELEDEA